jgi:hypothetical protein
MAGIAFQVMLAGVAQAQLPHLEALRWGLATILGALSTILGAL